MKKHASILWLTIVGLLFCINTSIADAGDLSNTNPDPTATKASWAPTTPDMVPWLVKWDEEGQIFKQYILDVEISGDDTTYFSQRCSCEIQANRVRWYPKFNNDLERQLAASKLREKRLACMSLQAGGYDNRTADSLSRVVYNVINGPNDSRPIINQVLSNSPNIQRLRALEEKDQEFDRRLNDLSASFATQADLATITTQVSKLDTTVAVSNAANDAQWSRTRGKSWEKTKESYGLVIIQAPQPTPQQKNRMPRPRPNL